MLDRLDLRITGLVKKEKKAKIEVAEEPGASPKEETDSDDYVAKPVE